MTSGEAGWLCDDVLSSLSDPDEEEDESDDEDLADAVFFDAADFLLRTEREGGRAVMVVDAGLPSLRGSSFPLSLDVSDSKCGSLRMFGGCCSDSELPNSKDPTDWIDSFLVSGETSSSLEGMSGGLVLWKNFVVGEW